MSIAWIGSAILILGIIILTIQAIERHWLGPLAAIIAIAVLCIGSISFSFITYHRSSTGAVAPAFLTVGILGLLCDIWAITFGMRWVEGWVGVSLMTTLCTIALIIAWTWKNLWLDFTILILGGIFLAFATIWLSMDRQNTFVSIGCLLILGIAGWVSTWKRNWILVDISAAVLFVCGTGWSADAGNTLQLTAASLGAISIITVLRITSTATGSSATTTAETLTRWVPSSLVPLAFLLGSNTLDTGTSILASHGSMLSIALTTCAVPIAWCLISGNSLATVDESQHLAPPTTSTSQTQYGYQLPQPVEPATVANTMRAAFGTGLIALATVLTVFHLSSESAWWLCILITTSGALLWFASSLPLVFTEAFTGYVALLGIPLLLPSIDEKADILHRYSWCAAGLYLVLGMVLFLRATTLRFTHGGIAGAEGVLLLLRTSSIPLLSREIEGSEQSFMVGHLAVSVLWMLLAVFFLLLKDARVGLAIAVGTTGKLVLYDLATLDGLIKVVTFILCGAILLACAVTRERRQGKLSDAPDTPPADALVTKELTGYSNSRR